MAEAVLSIRLVEPDLTNRLTRGHEWKLYLGGVMEGKDVERLEREIKANKIHSTLVNQAAHGAP
jgi:hypothetical protein